LIAPALIIVGVIVALATPWWIIEARGTSFEFTLWELIQEDDVLNMRTVVISAIGALMVIASPFVPAERRKSIGQSGAFLFLLLPGWSLYDAFTEEDVMGASLGAGWGLWVTAVIAIAVVVVMM